MCIRDRVYIGISNGGNFGVEGYGILVGDINPETGAMSAAYVVPTDGYPQTSGLIVNGYEEEDGYVYVYFLKMCIRDRSCGTRSSMVTIWNRICLFSVRVIISCLLYTSSSGTSSESASVSASSGEDSAADSAASSGSSGETRCV